MVAPAMTPRAGNVLSVVVAFLAVAYLAVMTYTGARPQQRQFVENRARGVLETAPDNVRAVVLKSGGTELRFRRGDGGWTREPGGAALSSQADSTLSRAVKFMHTATPVRILAPEELSGASLAAFGLKTPRLTVELSSGSDTLLEAGFGDANTDGFLQYMTVKGRPELFLMSRFVGAEWLSVADTARQ